MPIEQMQALDSWRETQPDNPSRSEAARRLITAALKAFTALSGKDGAS